MTQRPAKDYPLDRTDRYRIKRAARSVDNQQLVRWAEEGIAEDPDHVKWRRRTTRGTVLDYFAADAGVMIEYANREGRVSLLDLVDLGGHHRQP